MKDGTTITIQFPDGTKKSIKPQGPVTFAEAESEAWKWTVHGLAFRFPAIDGKIYEYRMDKADALELRDWLIENLKDE